MVAVVVDATPAGVTMPPGAATLAAAALEGELGANILLDAVRTTPEGRAAVVAARYVGSADSELPRARI